MMRILLMLGLVSLGDVATAQTACPMGVSPGDPRCGPSPSATGQNPLAHVPQVNWDTRWGAIAADGISGSLGTSVNMKSRRKAQKEALSKCREQGGSKCAIDITYYNQCAVMVLGDKKYNTASAATINEATELGMRGCQESNSDCRVYYADCSWPVRLN